MRVRKLIVECQADGPFMAMTEEGDVESFASSTRVVQWVKARDERAARRGESTTTVIEWRNVPDGFHAPGVA